MNSKASYFSISLPLIKENMRRFWAIPVISFLVYFLSGAFPILMTYDKINNIANYIQLSLENQQPFYMAAHLLVPVITAVVLYRYLQSVSSAAVMHSLPLTRAKLFNSNFISGLLMCIVPVLVNGLILLLLSKPAFEESGYEAEMMTSTVDVFTRMDVLNWIGISVLIVAVVYSIAVFSGIVTGNMFIHLMASFFFVFVITALYAVFYLYFDLYLYGFNASGQWEDICLAISPYTEVIKTEGHFTLIPLLFYLFTFVAMYVLSFVLYAKRKLERASDSLVFDFLKPIICYIIAFLGMTLLGVYFYYLGDESKAYLYAGFASGAVIFFIIGQMIILKTPRVFNLQTLKSFAIYGVLSVILIVGLNFDITGYETRTPDPGSIKSATMNESFDNVVSNSNLPQKDRDLQDPENLAALSAFHHSILENRARFEKESDDIYYSKTLSFEYDLKGLIDMSRLYTVDYDFFAKSAEMKQIFESLEYKSAISLYGLGVDSFDEIYFYGDQATDDQPIIGKASDVKELVAAIEKDIRTMPFEEAVSLKRYYATAEINFTYTDTTVNAGQKKQSSVSVNIPYSFANTITWLNAHGYDLALTADQVQYIDIYAIDDKNKGSVIRQDGGYAVMDSEHSSTWYSTEEYLDKFGENPVKPIMHITDKAKIEKVLANYDRDRITETNAYSVEISYRTNYTDPAREKTGYIYAFLNEGLNFLN